MFASDDRAGRMDDEAFQDLLLDGERIAWSGRPAGGILLTGRDLLLIPFSLLWGGFAIFWEWMVLRAPKAPVIMPLFGVPLVLAGIYFILGRFFADAWLRSLTRYAVTNQRVLMLRLPPLSNFSAMAIDRLPALSLEERSGGEGTIRFQGAPAYRGNGFAIMTPALVPSQFLAIPDARRVFELVQKQGRRF